MTSIPRGPAHPDALVNGHRLMGLDDSFDVDRLTGVATFRYPLRVTEGRSGFSPDLALTYDSSRGNSPFGLGWRLDVPSVGRRTCPETSRYREPDDDTFEVGNEELVPALRVSGGWVDDRFTVGEYLVQRYRRRYENAHERIERWVHQPGGQTYWRIVDANNVTSLFGAGGSSRISDPSDSSRILRWLLTERFDDRGNIIRYSYKRETLDGVDLDHPAEAHRRDRPEAQGAMSPNAQGGMSYLKRIDYANASPHDRGSWHLGIVLDYGEHDEQHPIPEEVETWSVRPDPYSTYRAGFETRVWRRCRRVLMFHSFEELGPDPYLVSSTDLEYDDDSGVSLLSSIGHSGFIHRESSREEKSLPRIRFGYQDSEFDDTVHTLQSESLVAALAVASLADTNLERRPRWLDLQGNGLPGVVSRSGEEWWYVANMGNGRFAEPERVDEGIALKCEEDTDTIDLTREDAAQAVVPAHGHDYQPLTTLRATADLNQDDPYVGYLDLNGDDVDDVVVADDSTIRWYPSQGTDGFGDPVVIHLDQADDTNSRRLYADGQQSFHVADMTGDGLADLVRVRSGEVCYWPNRSRGRFGERIVIGASPTLPVTRSGGGQVLLADLTGSGTTDLVWVGDQELRYWINIGGNHFSPPRRVAEAALSPGVTALGTVDLFGRGAACILWLDNTEDVPSVRYLSPVGDRCPNLLSSVSNGLGSEGRIAYKPSTHFAALDQAGGPDADARPSSAVPVVPVVQHVVERIERRDRVSGSHRVRRFEWHHGHYDVEAQHFNGFAHVEWWESGGPDEHSPDEHSPEGLYVRQFTHTGAFVEGKDLSKLLERQYFDDPVVGASWLHGHQMPLGQPARDVVEAYRALRGTLLRQETYGLDGSASSQVPYKIVESTAWVRQVQPARAGKPPSFEKSDYENVSVVYERSLNDPRIDHVVVLALDELGNVARSVNLTYGCRQPEHRSQAELNAFVTDNTVVNRNDQPTWYRIRVPIQSKHWQLIGLGPPEDDLLFQPGAIRKIIESLPEAIPGGRYDGPHKRVVEMRRTRYWSNDLSRQLDIGALESRGLFAREERLAFVVPMVNEIFEGKDLGETLRSEGGYELEGSNWWAPGQTIEYDAGRFYLPVSRRDAIGRNTRVAYDSTNMTVEEIEDSYQNVERFRAHPRTMQPWQHIDQNGNLTATRFDALGVVLSRAVVGKPEGSAGDVINTNSLEASAHDDPTVVVTHDLAAWDTLREPAWIRIRHRDVHGDHDTKVQDQIILLNGEGAIASIARRTDHSKWLISDVVERDRNGNSIREAVPFFSNKSNPEPADARAALAAGRRLTRDALGLIERIDEANGAFTTTERAAWTITHHDATDNALDSAWYADRHGSSQGRAGDFASRQAAGQHYEARSAALVAAHAHTPRTQLIDSAGRVAAERLRLTPHEFIEQVFERDWQGRLLSSTDGRGIVVQQTRFDLLGREMSIHHIDAGRSHYLRAATGDVLRCYDAYGRTTRYRYDANGRLTHTYFAADGGPEMLIERVIWGGGDVTVPNAEQQNLIGHPVLRLSSAGLLVTDSFDLNGNPLRQSLQLATDYDHVADWSAAADVTHVGQVAPRLADADARSLDSEVNTIQIFHDALSRPVRMVGFGGDHMLYEYGSHGQLDAVRVHSDDAIDERTILSEARYDAAGRPSVLRLGGGVWIRRTYDAAGLLSGMIASARNDEKVQDLRMFYDPIGNLMSVSDHGELVASFAYDALGRMIKAEGLEPAETADEDHALRRFAQTYSYDAAFNLLEVQHRAGSTEWTQLYDHQSGNQLRAHSTPEDEPGQFSATYQYDPSGSVIHGPAMQSYRWDNSGRLGQADTSDGNRVYYGYAQDGRLVQRIVARTGSVTEETVMLGPFERRRRYNHKKLVFEQFATASCVSGVPIAVVERTTRSDDAEQDDLDRSVRYQLTDYLGSVVAELSEDAELVTYETYLPSGAPSRRQARTPLELATKRFGWRGARCDGETGFILFADRWYSPEMGGYMSPLHSPPSVLNGYAFADANPQRMAHPSSSLQQRAPLKALTTQILKNILG